MSYRRCDFLVWLLLCLGVGTASLATFCIGCLVFIVVICYRLCWLFVMYGCVCCLVLFYSCCFVGLALCYSIYLLVVAWLGLVLW